VTPKAQAAPDSICEQALSLGFSAIGITAPDAASGELAHLNSWLAAGNAAQMSYMHRNPPARCDACSLLPGCASVIVVALDCTSLGPCETTRNGGKLARYAQGLDYHRVIHDKLKLLAEYLARFIPDQQHKICVDTSPVLEKAYAVAAGIGWRGRHTMVLNDRQGSFFMLGLLLTSAVLPTTSPHAGHCGECRRCITACPTGALSEPGVLDARKCISYWTTSAKEPRPTAFDTHGWGYGCDACQEACPYNARVLAAAPVD